MCACIWCRWMSEEGVRSPGSSIKDVCELPCECWESNLGPLGEQQVHVTALPPVAFFSGPYAHPPLCLSISYLFPSLFLYGVFSSPRTSSSLSSPLFFPSLPLLPPRCQSPALLPPPLPTSYFKHSGIPPGAKLHGGGERGGYTALRVYLPKQHSVLPGLEHREN